MDQLDGPVRSIGVEHRRIPGVSAVWLVDNVFKRRMLGPYFERNRMPGYVEAFDTLLTEARRTRELLLRIYQGNASIRGNEPPRKEVCSKDVYEFGFVNVVIVWVASCARTRQKNDPQR